MPRPLAVALVMLPLLLAACGGDESDDGDKASTDEVPSSFDRAIAEAQQVSASDFPAPQARTLQQIADTLPAINVGLATSVFVPGKNRVAFGLIDKANRFAYGRTALYLARSPNDKARGPFPAPADPLVVEPRFRGRDAAKESSGIAAIYSTNVSLPAAGRWYVLAVTRSGGRLYGAATQIDVKRTSPIPAVGQRPPRVSTDTVASAGGDTSSIDTRVPPDDMHQADFRDVVGKKPVALLFSTPALCESRVCGPVTDIAAQLQKRYGDRVAFIHQEVFVANKPNRGLRKPLRDFSLRSEPWLFTFDKQGRVAARLEGSFGTVAFRNAVVAAIR